jgi:NAD(P)-dependent dehydrogenase (short-subunit alcohol dehydrogenase family)
MGGSYHLSMNSLQGKTALITGGSSGIGRAAAVRLAGLGVQVALAARNREALAEVQAEIEGHGGKCICAPTDVTSADQVQQAVERAVGTFGKLDILLCSAGLSMRAYF